MPDKKSLKETAVTGIKGAWVGGTMLVPGVSGGSMAMILGIYDRLVSAVSSFMEERKANLGFLCSFSIGALLGMLLFAVPILKLLQKYPMPVIYFFLGAVAGGIPMIIRKAGMKKFSWKTIVYPAAGGAAVMLLSLVPAGNLAAGMDMGLLKILFLLAAGMVAAVALVLPGISVSYLLLLLGLYEETMKAIGSLDIAFLLPLGTGVILGILLSTKALEKAMVKCPQMTYLVILGFILGSVAEIFPGIPTGSGILPCILLFAAGFAVIWGMSRLERLQKPNSDQKKEILAESSM